MTYAEAELCRILRSTFSNAEGKLTLAYILNMCGYWCRISTDEERIRRNVAYDLLQVMGISEGGNTLSYLEHILDEPFLSGSEEVR